MGLLIALAGHKRFCTKNAMFLMHDGTDFVVDSSAKAMDRLEFNKRMEDRLKQYVVSLARSPRRNTSRNTGWSGICSQKRPRETAL